MNNGLEFAGFVFLCLIGIGVLLLVITGVYCLEHHE